jgi:hypothetical protein
MYKLQHRVKLPDGRLKYIICRHINISVQAIYLYALILSMSVIYNVLENVTFCTLCNCSISSVVLSPSCVVLCISTVVVFCTVSVWTSVLLSSVNNNTNRTDKVPMCYKCLSPGHFLYDCTNDWVCKACHKTLSLSLNNPWISQPSNVRARWICPSSAESGTFLTFILMLSGCARPGL